MRRESLLVRPFTPRTPDGTRLTLHLSEADHQKIGRGKGWKATVTDIETGKTYNVHAASCGLSCYCDAIAVEVPTDAAIREARAGLIPSEETDARPDITNDALRHSADLEPRIILVSVYGGIAEVVAKTVPDGVKVEIIDIDNLKAGDSLRKLSKTAKKWLKSEWPELAKHQPKEKL